jgi:hypothetical protein
LTLEELKVAPFGSDPDGTLHRRPVPFFSLKKRLTAEGTEGTEGTEDTEERKRNMSLESVSGHPADGF